ncbi:MULTISPECIES: hypothetical protein [unclassified Bradyrhizobium]|uniref:hypothetical protein n=1 Tax=unclassified Bradyrhizobium TaxID=2631580 RepID=UPI001BA7EC72|nr:MULTISPECIES: hypothetical protein [unclassified Bradyrhizobium]MBR1226223.1 hypothetical protein [Bradyrhizobium sp. AUGA SZCCT0176]MBR1295365.1 hypothetical protein [Bradyrhizobium sp. AUGA SZCCT0042]
MLKWLRRILVVIAILIAVSVLGPLAYIEGTCRPSSSASASPAPSVTLPAINEPRYQRKQNNTFFTFPEWYIVYSFEDFGRFLDRSSESHFNYLGHIFGFWRSFCTINQAVPSTGESLTEVKTMIYIIGVSYSIEYAIKGFYENTIGRVFEWIRGEERTPQDLYARKVLQDYAAFLYTVPWFKFPFREKLDGLMAISARTDSPLRTWERYFALGTEYYLKVGYAALIQKALDAGGDDEPRDIMFAVATLPPAVLAKEPRIKPIRTLTPQWQLVQAPRYKDFTEILQSLLDQGYGLAEIAGNREILITVIAPDAAKLDVKGTTELFSLELDGKPGFRRAGLKARIDRLVDINRDLKARGVSIEHFYDY